MKKKIFTFAILLILSNLSFAQWSDNAYINKILSADLNKSMLPKIAVCPNGNYYVSWMYDDNLNFNTYLHYYDKNGNQLWEEPLLISDHQTRTWITDYSLIADKDNCAVITFQDIRNYNLIIDNSDVFAYRISPTGEFLWGKDGINLSPNANLFTASPKVCETKEGNYIVAWNAAQETFRDTVPDKCMIFISKLNKDGEILWENPIKLQDTLWQFFFPNLVASGDDDFIIQWLQYELIEDPLIGKLAWRYIYCQKYGNDGTPLWESNIAIFDTIGISPGTYLIPEAKSDGDDGIIVVWRIGNEMAINIKAQHITKNGIEKWQHNGIMICANENIDQDYPKFDYDPIAKDLYVFWIIDYYDDVELTYYVGLYGNKINDNGDRVWGDNGIEYIEPINVSLPFPFVEDVSYHNNNVLLLFSISNKQTSKDNRMDTLKAALFDKDGNYVWKTKYIDVCNNPSYKMFTVLSKFANDQWVAVWGDSRNTLIDYHQDIYGQNINLDGTIGVKGSSVESNYNKLYKIYPNPAKDIIYLQSYDENYTNIEVGTDGFIHYSIFNTLGESLITGNLEENNMRIDISLLPSGVYLLKIGEKQHFFVKI